MELLETRLEGPLALRPRIHGDERGWFQETYRRDFLRELGVADDFVQDNQSRSRRGVVRGLHLQLGAGQAKLVRCARGSAFDVVVDVRRGSPTFGHWEAFEIDDRVGIQVYCPVGFAHGFCATSETADVAYKCSSYYDSRLERAIAWNDPEIGIEWPAGLELIVSGRDAAAPPLSELAPEIPFAYERG